ncbi:MAG: ricin-type beta-trefoil lectin domain protein [Myxococcota bacterium]
MRTSLATCTLALLGFTALGACGGPEDLEDTEDALASGAFLFQNSQALFVERCLVAPGQAGVAATAAVCDRNRADEGFFYETTVTRRWLRSQTTGPGRCLTVSGTKVLLQPCVESAANQAFARNVISTSPVFLAQYQNGSACLALGADATTSMVACNTTAKNQLWTQAIPNTLGVALNTGPLNPLIPAVSQVIQEVATVKASAQTIAETQGRIQRWKIHPIAYQPKGVAQQNAGLIITGHDINDAARSFISGQAVRNTAQANDFHAQWRVIIGGTNYISPEVVYVGGAVTKSTGQAPDSWTDAMTLVAMLRRDLLAVAADNTLVSAPALTKLQQTTLVARSVPAFGILLRGTLATTPATALTEVPVWTQLAASVMPLGPRNGYPGDANAAPSLCSKSAKLLGGAGISESACAANPLTIPAGKTCGYQDATSITTSLLSCNWVCCPIAL